MAARLHPADAAEAAIISRADHFAIALFRGTGVYARATAPTLPVARIVAAELENEIANGRRALIYAVTAEGRSALVTRNSLKAMEMING